MRGQKAAVRRVGGWAIIAALLTLAAPWAWSVEPTIAPSSPDPSPAAVPTAASVAPLTGRQPAHDRPTDLPPPRIVPPAPEPPSPDVRWPTIEVITPPGRTHVDGVLIDFTVCSGIPVLQWDCVRASDVLTEEQRTIDSPSDLLSRTVLFEDVGQQIAVQVDVLRVPAGYRLPDRSITAWRIIRQWTDNDLQPRDGRITFRIAGSDEPSPSPTPTPTSTPTPTPTPTPTRPPSPTPTPTLTPTPTPTPSVTPTPTPRPTPTPTVTPTPTPRPTPTPTPTVTPTPSPTPTVTPSPTPTPTRSHTPSPRPTPTPTESAPPPYERPTPPPPNPPPYERPTPRPSDPPPSDRPDAWDAPGSSGEVGPGPSLPDPQPSDRPSSPVAPAPTGVSPTSQEPPAGESDPERPWWDVILSAPLTPVLLGGLVISAILLKLAPPPGRPTP